MVIKAVPFWFAAGVTVTVRLAPLTANTMLALGTRVGLDDVPLTIKLPTAVSASPTVKGIAPVAVSSLVACGPMPVMVGAVLAAATIGVFMSNWSSARAGGRL